MGPEA